jgi:hypothetical protein
MRKERKKLGDEERRKESEKKGRKRRGRKRVRNYKRARMLSCCSVSSSGRGWYLCENPRNVPANAI